MGKEADRVADMHYTVGGNRLFEWGTQDGDVPHGHVL